MLTSRLFDTFTSTRVTGSRRSSSSIPHHINTGPAFKQHCRWYMDRHVLIFPLVDVWADMTRNVRACVEVSVILRQHVDIVKDVAVKVGISPRHHKRCVHQWRLVEHRGWCLHPGDTQLPYAVTLVGVYRRFQHNLGHTAPLRQNYIINIKI